MSLLKKQENLIREEKDLDRFTGVLMPDRTIEKGITPYNNRRGHNYELRTALEDKLIPKATTTSLDKYLKLLSQHIEDQTKERLVNVLKYCRDYIEVYFNSTHTNPVYINDFRRGSSDIESLKKMIGNARVGIDYFGGNIISKGMQEHITLTSLYLREIIANTVGFNEVAHYPSQVKDKLSNYKLKAFLFDSHYSLGEGGKVIDSREVVTRD